MGKDKNSDWSQLEQICLILAKFEKNRRNCAERFKILWTFYLRVIEKRISIEKIFPTFSALAKYIIKRLLLIRPTLLKTFVLFSNMTDKLSMFYGDLTLYIVICDLSNFWNCIANKKCFPHKNDFEMDLVSI